MQFKWNNELEERNILMDRRNKKYKNRSLWRKENPKELMKEMFSKFNITFFIEWLENYSECNSKKYSNHLTDEENVGNQKVDEAFWKNYYVVGDKKAEEIKCTEPELMRENEKIKFGGIAKVLNKLTIEKAKVATNFSAHLSTP